MDSPELPLVVRKPAWPWAVVSLAAAAVATYLLTLPDIYSAPVRFGCVFVLYLVVAAGAGVLVQRKPDLVISADGIEASAWGGAFFRWDEIDRAFVVSREGNDYLCFTLRHADELLGRGSPLVELSIAAARAGGLGDLMLEPSSLRLDTKEALPLINSLAHWHRSALKPPASAVRYRTD